MKEFSPLRKNIDREMMKNEQKRKLHNAGREEDSDKLLS